MHISTLATVACVTESIFFSFFFCTGTAATRARACTYVTPPTAVSFPLALK